MDTLPVVSNHADLQLQDNKGALLMCTDLPFKGKIALTAKICLLYSLFSIPAIADETTTVDEYISAAQPYLHLSCEGAWEVSGENDEEYINIIHRLIPITFINHDFDVALVQQAPQADQEKLSKLFYDEVGLRCRERPQSLLAGVVDRSVVYAFGEVAPEAETTVE
jgi:hypothetical protein